MHSPPGWGNATYQTKYAVTQASERSLITKMTVALLGLSASFGCEVGFLESDQLAEAEA